MIIKSILNFNVLQVSSIIGFSAQVTSQLSRLIQHEAKLYLTLNLLFLCMFAVATPHSINQWQQKIFLVRGAE